MFATNRSESHQQTNMNQDKPAYWFPAKRYGWGWGPPNCWQGWLALFIYVALSVTGIPLLDATHHTVPYLIYISALTIAMVVVCWLKGEQPKWRWGKN